MLDTLFFLIENYWGFLAAALVIGCLTGWFSAAAD